MGQIVDIGRRIELVSMDPHFHDITIALYRQQGKDGPVFRVHSYSRREGVAERVGFVIHAMQVLGEMECVPDGLLRFPCGAVHEQACKRLFREACKLDPVSGVEPRPLTILDRKSGLNVEVAGEGNGEYRVRVGGDEADGARRVRVIANGLAKLGEMRPEGEDRVVFGCGVTHDALVGLLLVRAPNVRAVVREEEQTASRGVLAAPSAQDR